MHDDTTALLQALDSLHHSARVARTVREVRASSDPGRLLDDLEAPALAGDALQGAYLGHLCVQGAQAIRDVDRLRRLAHAPSRRVRAIAVKALCRLLPPALMLVEEVLAATPETRRRLLSGVARTQRADVAEQLIPKLLERRLERDAARLLPVCTDDSARAMLKRVDAAFVPWDRMARWRPDVAVDRLEETLAGAEPHRRGYVWAQLGGMARPLARHRPQRLLDLMQRFGTRQGLAPFRKALGLVATAAPDPTLNWLLDSCRRDRLLSGDLPGRPERWLRAASDDVRRRLARALAPSPERLASMLASLAPRERGELFRHAYAETDTGSSAWPDALLEVLPHKERHREARRMLGLRDTHDDLSVRLARTACLPLAEARPVLEEAAGASKAEHRALALRQLVRCASLNRAAGAGLARVLEVLRRIANDQDPVRGAAFEALSRVPPSCFGEADLAVLGELVTHVAQARDTSWSTRSRVKTLACRVLVAGAREPEGEHFRFGLETLRTLAEQDGILGLPMRLDQGLPRGLERRVADVFLPWLKASTQLERHYEVQSFATALKKRAWGLVALQAMLEEAIWARDTAQATQAAALWLQDPAHRDERVRALLDRDESAILLPAVFDHLHRRRQDWLDPFLERRSVRGRFASGKVVHVLPAHDGFLRWLPRQQRALAALLHEVARDPKHHTAVRTRTIRWLAQMPTTTVEELSELLHREDVALVEAALGAMAQTDDPCGALPILLDHVDGDRARVAMYAVPSLTRVLPQDRLVDAMTDLLARGRLKVTVLKEALRLLASYPSPRAVALLLRVWRRESLHRDVRIAATHAARRLLDLESAWEIVDAAASGDPEFGPYPALALLEWSPSNLPMRHRARYVRACLRLATHADAEVRLALFQALGPSWWVTAGGDDALAVEVATAARDAAADLAEPRRVWPVAARALMEQASWPASHDVIAGGVESLLAAARTETLEPGEERDLPAHQRLVRLVGMLVGESPWVLEQVRPVLDRLAEALADSARFWPERAALVVAGLDLTDAEAVKDTLREVVAEAPEPSAVAEVSTRLASAVSRADRTPEQAQAEALVGALVTSSDAALRAVAVRALKTAGTRFGWPRALREHLATLRRDEDPAVRTAALRTWTAAE